MVQSEKITLSNYLLLEKITSAIDEYLAPLFDITSCPNVNHVHHGFSIKVIQCDQLTVWFVSLGVLFQGTRIVCESCAAILASIQLKEFLDTVL